MERERTKSRNIMKKNWFLILNIVITVLLGLLHALEATHYVNFIPVNGTFQDYNPIRRMLSGQIPYRDFQDYLGLGHLYLGSLFTAIFGGKYVSSLMTFRFLPFVCTALILNVMGNVILKNKGAASAFANVLLCGMMVSSKLLGMGGDEGNIIYAINYAMSTGNSARFIRGMILPICCIAIGIGMAKGWKCVPKRWRNNRYVPAILMGFLAGFCFAWSNDYGVSCWLCLLIMTFLMYALRFRKLGVLIRTAFCEIICSVCGIFISVEIFTLGHFTEWFSSTFGTGGYQRWYYNSYKSYYFWDVDFAPIMLAQAVICLAYLVILYKKGVTRSHIIRYGIPAFANMTCFCAANEYKLLAGNKYREVALIVLFGTIVFELIGVVKKWNMLQKAYKGFSVASVVISVGFCAVLAQKEIAFASTTGQDGIYVEELGGYMTSLGDDLLETKDFLQDEAVFATYASAQEVLSDKFQPSGTDYIIHVLGDPEREDYLDCFKAGDFRYAATISDSYTGWEYWAVRANWFFYRELFENWHPVYANSYEWYWERNTEENSVFSSEEEITVTVEYLSDAHVKISVDAPENVSGLADVFVDYSTDKNGGLSSKALFQKMVLAENTGICFYNGGDYFQESNYLREANCEYILVSVVNGHGEVLLTSKPERSTTIQLHEVSCSRIFQTQYQYVEVDDISVADGQVCIRVPNRDRTGIILNQISEVTIEGGTYEIDSAFDCGDGYSTIVICCEDSQGILEYFEETKENVVRVE